MTASNSVSPATRIHPPTRYRRHRHGQFACNHEQSIVNGLSQTAPPPGRVGPGRAGSWRDDESSPRSCSRGSGKSRCHYDKSRRRTLLSISHVARVNLCDIDMTVCASVCFVAVLIRLGSCCRQRRRRQQVSRKQPRHNFLHIHVHTVTQQRWR